MQQGGQYGEVPPQFARPTSSAPTATTGNANTTHAHLFNLSHEVAAAAGGLGLSTNSPSISHAAAAGSGHHHHAAGHSFPLGQVHQHHHSLHHQQPQQSYLHFQDHLSHHHHQQQSLQSSSHTCQQQQLVDQSVAASSSSSSAGLHLHQSQQKQGMVPSVSMSVQQHASSGQEGQTQQMQQTSILQQQYTQPQQQHGLGLGLDSKPSIVTTLQQGARGLQQQQQQVSGSSSQGAISITAPSAAASTGPAINNVTQTQSPPGGNSLMSSSTLVVGGTSTMNITSNVTATAVPPILMSNNMQQVSAGTALGGSSIINKQDNLIGAAVGSLNNMQQVEEMQDATGDELDKGGSGGNRWPRQETLALLKVRSEMDSSFRDSSLKRPLWDEVSRKLAELGFHRSAKKCKEKFENVHKYYKRTKEGKAGRQDGKNYRFFSELEALYGNAGYTPSNLNMNTSLTTASLLSPNRTSSILMSDPLLDCSAGNNQSRGADMGRSSAAFLLGTSLGAPSRSSDVSAARIPNPATSFMRPQLATDATGLNFSSETSSDDDDNDDEYDDPSDAAPESKKRKRKTLTRMMAFFESLLKQVMEKQEQMQQRFLEALERREQERMIREEAWKRQEMARMNKENDLRAQERSLSATRDAAIVAFLQKVTGQTVHLPTSTSLAIAAQPVQVHPPGPTPLSSVPLDPLYHHNIPEDQDPFDPNSKRWPKPEVLALIKLRTGLHSRFTEPGPKGPLWEDIASGMARLGYNRNAKRCKEKWENINKYFKKAKESNKNRPENAKTCPYYHQLDALYKQGVLGSGNITSSIKALPYRPSDNNLDTADNPMQLHQASARGSREGDLVAHGSTNADQLLAIMPPPASQVSTASDATTSTGNANALAGNVTSAATQLLSSSNPDISSTGGDMAIDKDINIQATSEISPTRAVDVNTSDRQVVIESTATRPDQLSEGIAMQMQRGVDDPQHPHSSSTPNQGYVEHKVELEQDARLVDEDEVQQKQHVLLQQQQHLAAAQQAHIQQFQQERLPATLAQLAGPATTSFIANMLQKFNNDPAESNTSTTSTNQ